MSKAVKSIGRALKKVVKGVSNVVKKVAGSKFGKILMGAALVYFGGAALMGAAGGASAGAAAGQGFLGTLQGGLSGALSGAAQGISGAWQGLTSAASALGGGLTGQTSMGQALQSAGSSLGGGMTGAYQAGQSAVSALPSVATGGAPGAGAFTGATPTGLPTVAADAANIMAPKQGLISGMWDGLGPYGKAAAVSGGLQLAGGAYADYKTAQAQKEADRQRNANIGTRLWGYA